MRGRDLALALTSSALLVAGCGDGTAGDARPDIVLVVVDTLRADHVGIYGHSRETTPEIDALARGGSFFRRAYAQSSWTLPSIASLLTGLLPHEHRVGRHPGEPVRFGTLAREIPTLAERLGEAGYARGAIVNNTYLDPEFGLAKGFGEDYDYHAATKRQFRSAESSVEAAIDWIGARERPFFLLLHMMEPHQLYDPPTSVRGTFTGLVEPPVEVPFGTKKGIEKLVRERDPAARDYVEKLYDEEILYVDRAIGRLVEELKLRRRWDRTVIIVTSDHGEEFFDHGGFEHGHTLFSELIRVPLVVHGPGLARGEVAGVVQHVDVARGILGLAGASTAGLAEGLDPFAALAAGDAIGDRPSLSENVLYGAPRASYTDGRVRLVVNLEDKRSRVFGLSEEGAETQPAAGLELDAERERLAREMSALRGGLDAWETYDRLRLDDEAILEKLEALGYIERP